MKAQAQLTGCSIPHTCILRTILRLLVEAWSVGVEDCRWPGRLFTLVHEGARAARAARVALAALFRTLFRRRLLVLRADGKVRVGAPGARRRARVVEGRRHSSRAVAALREWD